MMIIIMMPMSAKQTFFVLKNPVRVGLPPSPSISMSTDMRKASSIRLRNKYICLLAGLGHLCCNFEIRGAGWPHEETARNQKVFILQAPVVVIIALVHEAVGLAGDDLGVAEDVQVGARLHLA